MKLFDCFKLSITYCFKGLFFPSGYPLECCVNKLISQKEMFQKTPVLGD